jgi:TolB-like protein/tetratricopeptide (TPR) repeat protein
MASDQEQFEFEGFVLHGGRRELQRRDGSAIALTPRLYNALYLFVGRPGELIDKRELMASLWQGLVVEENNLSQLILALRRALDDSEGRLIRTEPRRGFRFAAEVRAMHRLPPAASGFPSEGLRTTLAVLPFAPLASTDRGGLLGLGMADTLIARLSTLPQLVVRSVGAVRRFAGVRRDAVQAGRELDVDWVVDGTLQDEGKQLRASARLLSVADGSAVWSDRFDAAWTSMFDVQDQIAERVAQALGRHLTHVPKATRNVDAYQLYLGGLNHAQSVAGDGLQKSIELFQHALQIDPGYSLAHIGIAEACRRMVFGADRQPLEVYRQWRPHQARALELSPDLPEAHAQLGWLRYWADHDWAGAERAYRHALSLNSSLAHAAFGMGFMLVVIGRVEEGLAFVRRARELDPTALLACTIEATFLQRQGDMEGARLRLSRVLEFAPQFWIAHMAMAVWHEERGELDAALAAIEQAGRLNPHSSQPVSMKGALLVQARREAEARTVLEELQLRAAERHVSPTSIASIQASLGERDAALDSLERAFDGNDARLLYMRDDSRWFTLRAEPRFQRLVERMNLADLPPGLAPP